jgi:hypothetical protein
MAKRPTTAKKSVSAANLAALGADRLADLLMEAGAADAALKRRLRMELAAEVGAADLAFEIDKRLAALGASRARVSWRKRPALLNDLRSLLRITADRLASLDSRLALDRLVAWFDLYPGLVGRVSDAKGELPLLFDAATAELAAVASAAGPDVAGPVLVEALSTRLDPWASWVGRSSPGLDPAVARRVLAGLPQGVRPTGRLALVIRKLADRAGDLDAWIRSIPDEDARKPEVGAGIARRLALAGRAGEGRAALEASRVEIMPKARWGRSADAGAPSDAWSAAEIAVLEAEGRWPEADEARWARFARTLSADDLRALIARLPDFEDVEALDRAFEMAAAHPDAMRGLAFLMTWPALREAAALVVARADEIRGGHEDLPLWVGRLVGRTPLAALILVRARARALLMLGPDVAGEVQALVSEAEAIWSTLGEDASTTDHETFAAGLQLEARRRRVW